MIFRISSPQSEDKGTLKYSSDNFPYWVGISGFMENCRNDILMHLNALWSSNRGDIDQQIHGSESTTYTFHTIHKNHGNDGQQLWYMCGFIWAVYKTRCKYTDIFPHVFLYMSSDWFFFRHLFSLGEGVALRAKKVLLTQFVLILGHFWCSVVTSVIFSSNLSNFEKNKIDFKKIKKYQKKNRLNQQQKIMKNPKI